LGDASTDERDSPVAVAGGHTFRQLDAGSDFTCGVSYPDNHAWCWGTNSMGQLGDGTKTGRLTPVAVAGGLTFQQVQTGALHACGITTTNVAYCWGFNQYGRLGDSTNVTRARPTRVAAGSLRFRQIDAGGDHTCAVTTTDRAYCWGNGKGGALGIGKAIVSFWPRAVSGGLSFRRVTTGWGHTCGETPGSLAYCWGDNFQGELGDGTMTARLKPVRVTGGLSFAQVSAGSNYTCGKTAANVAYCWGDNTLGAVGDGTWQNTRTRPTLVTDAD
jgi:alpha-tubulin suppressor-like RCC1 family protein